jgi:hypothetical protein
MVEAAEVVVRVEEVLVDMLSGSGSVSASK